MKCEVVLIFLVAIFVNFSEGSFGLKNECTTWDAYLNILFSSKCYHNPDLLADSPEIIKRHFGAENYEKHSVITDDGYILTMFRIKRPNNRGVIILQHPITADGVCWLLQGTESLAYVLWQMNYEIWIPNHRGTVFSEGHTKYSANDIHYWNFSFHEIGMYDYPKFIEKIIEVSKVQQIAFVGHSMSGTSGLAMASLMPEFTKKYINVMVLISSAANLKYVRSPLKYASIFVNFAEQITTGIGWGGLFRPKSLEKLFVQSGVVIPFKYPIVLFLCIFGGWTPENSDPKFFNRFAAHIPRGSGWKVLYHFAQIYNAGGEFQLYDHGKERNLELYNATKPPKYPLEKVQAPIFIVASSDDSMGTLKDNEDIYAKLPQEAKIYGNLTVKGLNHFDYHAGKNRFKVVYEPIFKLFDDIFTQTNKFTQKNSK